MFKVIRVKEALGGSLIHQAGLWEALVQSLEQQLNDLKVVKVHSVSPYREDAEFGLVAVVEVEAKASKYKGDKK